MEFAALAVAIGALILGVYSFKTSQKIQGETQSIKAEQRRQEAIVLVAQAQIILDHQLRALHGLEGRGSAKSQDDLYDMIKTAMGRREILTIAGKGLYNLKNISAAQRVGVETLYGSIQAVVADEEDASAQMDKILVDMETLFNEIANS